jgi:hypothetical protein
MRKYVRHPTQVPIEIDVDESNLERIDSNMLDISAGGLAFCVPRTLSMGARLTISLPELWPNYQAQGFVVWCHEVGDHFEAGIKFAEASEAFKARMVAQFCQIQDYKRTMQLNEGRDLSSEEAAREWIGRYAEEFANSMGCQ